MARRSKHLAIWIFLCIATALGAALLFLDVGTVQYLAFESGMTSPMRLGDVVLRMNKGWYKRVSSEGFLGQFVIKAEVPTLIIAKRNGPLQADSMQIVLTQLPSQTWAASRNEQSRASKIETFGWGSAAILDGEFIAEIPKYCIKATVVDWRKGPSVREALGAVISIRRDQGNALNNSLVSETAASACL